LFRVSGTHDVLAQDACILTRIQLPMPVLLQVSKHLKVHTGKLEARSACAATSSIALLPFAHDKNSIIVMIVGIEPTD